MSETFVLVHGTWHGGWSWQSVVRNLQARGHQAYAPTLAGHEPGADAQGLTHQDYVDSVVSAIVRQKLTNITLVGHSVGGTVVSRLVTYMPERIKRLVFLDAFILAHNECVFDILPPQYVGLFTQLAHASRDNTMLLPFEIWQSNFIQDAPKDVAKLVWELLVPEPAQSNMDRLDLNAFYTSSIPRSFIYCEQDMSLPPGFFHPYMSSRLGNFKLVTMGGSHEVIFTRPSEVASKIIEASTD